MYCWSLIATQLIFVDECDTLIVCNQVHDPIWHRTVFWPLSGQVPKWVFCLAAATVQGMLNAEWGPNSSWSSYLPAPGLYARPASSYLILMSTLSYRYKPRVSCLTEIWGTWGVERSARVHTSRKQWDRIHSQAALISELTFNHSLSSLILPNN